MNICYRRTFGVIVASISLLLMAGCPREATFTIRVVNNSTRSDVQAIYLAKGADLSDPELVTTNLLDDVVPMGERRTITVLVSLAESTGATLVAFAVPDENDPTVDVFGREAAGFEARDRYVLTVENGSAGGHEVTLDLLPF